MPSRKLIDCGSFLAMWLVAITSVMTFGTPSAGEQSVSEINETPITPSDRSHWAFQPLSRAEPPAVKKADWVRNTIDRFILSKLEAAALSPLPPADRVTLIRRVTFDLTGLPPTPAEVEAFVNDSAPNAYEKLLDRLLAAPVYGERWAQHWLDLARFAETDGFEHDYERPNAWRYRDWVIHALNRDVPLDEFIRLQLAGDELYPGDAAATIATGFLLCGPDMPDINDQEERRSSFLNDMTGTVSAVFLGLQLGCAQCHDHKYDPLSQADFYRLRAFFDPAEIFKDHPVELMPAGVTKSPEIAAMVAELKQHETRIEELEETVRARLRVENPDFQPKPSDLIKAFTDDEKQQHAAATSAIAKLKKDGKLPPMPLARVMREKSSQAKPSHLLIRGDFRRVGPEVSPAFPRVVNVSTASVTPPTVDAPTTGRRAQLARWLTSSENPLTTRVLVNRIWQFHFGKGLVATPSDFGFVGDAPTHSELLDWLAAELPRQEWSLKRMHKLILTSATYQQASHVNTPGWTADQTAAANANWNKAKEVDPENRLLSHMPRLRLEGEAIRDAMLAASDRLSDRRGGPGVRPPLPPEMLSTLLKNQWNVSPNEEDHRRRSVYLFVRRNLRYPLFEAFDRPDTNASCPRRNRSTIAPQALMLLNSEFSLAAARELSGYVLRVCHEKGTHGEAAAIDLAYRRALGRAPTADELQIATNFVSRESARLKETGRTAKELAVPPNALKDDDRYAAAALTELCLALFNLNEFVYVD